MSDKDTLNFSVALGIGPGLATITAFAFGFHHNWQLLLAGLVGFIVAMVPMALFVDRFFDEAGQLNTPYRKWIVEGSSAVTIVLILVILAVKP